MKITEKMKRFFTLNAARSEGFTLVELIVVIAILAILAGVAIPAYSGYIEKSKRAGDMTLLNAVNKSFASALSANGSDIYFVSNAKVAYDADGSVAGVESISFSTGAVDPDDVNNSFIMFFEGNDGAKFEVIEPVFDIGRAMFVAKGEESGTIVSLGGGKYLISSTIINAFTGSVFADKVPAMQEQLGGISKAFGDVVGNVATAGKISPALKEFMENNKYGDEDLGNAAVLYVAQNAGNYTAQDVADIFTGLVNDDPQNMQEMLNAFEGEDALTNIALMYGAATAYANSDMCNDPNLAGQLASVHDANSLMAALGALNGTGSNWGTYMGTVSQDEDGTISVTAGDQFTADMNGFFGAMDAINTVSPDVKTDDAEFWQSTDVNNLLNSLLGNQ